jgi:hypothetical protein
MRPLSKEYLFPLKHTIVDWPRPGVNIKRIGYRYIEVTAFPYENVPHSKGEIDPCFVIHPTSDECKMVAEYITTEGYVYQLIFLPGHNKTLKVRILIVTPKGNGIPLYSTGDDGLTATKVNPVKE